VLSLVPDSIVKHIVDKYCLREQIVESEAFNATITLSVFYKCKIFKLSSHQYKKLDAFELPQVPMREPMIGLLFPDFWCL
jgi:hypothetical protein